MYPTHVITDMTSFYSRTKNMGHISINWNVLGKNKLQTISFFICFAFYFFTAAFAFLTDCWLLHITSPY